MIKRILDITVSAVALIVLSPLLVPIAFLIYFQDRFSPFYVAVRVGKNEKPFKMIKFRSMIMNADRSGVDSTKADDPRITKVGMFVRRYKLDEIPQLFNVIMGDMSLVGPRPNVKRETDIYTPVEKNLLSVRPGITDLASIVFSDENEILKGSPDPDLDYNQRIRPWKSRLALLGVQHQSLKLDLSILFLTATALVSREKALKGVSTLLSQLPADPQVRDVAERKKALIPFPPPGANQVVMQRC